MRHFCHALAFYTRLPCDRWVKDFKLAQTYPYLSAVGWWVGAWTALIFIIFSALFDHNTAVIFSMTSGLILTGGFHEDGWADVCDGFGGGFSPEQILAIMQDSRLGTYGVLGLCLLLGLKFSLLSALNPSVLPWIMIAGHVISRFCLVWPLYASDYICGQHSKMAGSGQKITGQQIGYVTSGLLPLAFFLPWWLLFCGLGFALLSSLTLNHYFKQRLGGYTGDCLGATQQLSEISFYLIASLVFSGNLQSPL